MTVPTQKEIVVALSNHPGALATTAAALGDAGIDVRGFMATAPGGFPLLRFVPADLAAAEKFLRTTTWKWRTSEVVAVPGVDQPGEIGRIASALAGTGVNIEAAYPIIAAPGKTIIAFAVDDLGRAKKALA
jgi:hypothetical protein